MGQGRPALLRPPAGTGTALGQPEHTAAQHQPALEGRRLSHRAALLGGPQPQATATRHITAEQHSAATSAHSKGANSPTRRYSQPALAATYRCTGSSIAVATCARREGGVGPGWAAGRARGAAPARPRRWRPAQAVLRVATSGRCRGDHSRAERRRRVATLNRLPARSPELPCLLRLPPRAPLTSMPSRSLGSQSVKASWAPCTQGAAAAR